MGKSRADEARTVGVGGGGCAEMCWAQFRVWKALRTDRFLHSSMSALWLHLAIREMKSVWAHLPESWGTRVPSVEDGHHITRWPSTLLYCTVKHWNFEIVQSLGYSERFWWISNISMHPSFISVAVYNLAENSLGKKGFTWFTVPHCSPSLRVSQGKNSNP